MGELRDFDAYLKENGGGRPEFIVGGQKFTARGKLPWKKFTKLIQSMTSDDEASEGDEISRTEAFFRLVLVPADKQRFMDLLNHDGDDDEDDDNTVGVLEVREILTWLMKHYNTKAEEANEKEEDSTAPAIATVTSLTPKAGA